MKNKTILSLAILAVFSFLPFRQEGVFPNLEKSPVFADEDMDEVKDDIKDLEKDRKKEMEILERYEGDVSRLQGAVYATQKDINETEEKIETVEETIERKEKEIEILEKSAKFKKSVLKKTIQESYLNSEQPLLYLLLENSGFFNVITSSDSYLRVKEEVLSLLDEIRQTKEKIGEEKTKLEEEKENHAKLLWTKEVQKNSLVSEKREFEVKVQEKKLTVAEIDAKISKLRSVLSSFLGESFDAGDIVEAIEFASKKTGVREEFLMAMLDKESDLGRFTGGCTYKNTKVKDSDREAFKEICEELDYDYKKQKISCALSYGYGGAMGVAQFMPTTWMGYKDAISSYTGHNPPDPWNLTDGVTGMAEKLRRAGGDSKKGEHYAAKVYYCGGPGSAYWNTHCEAYANTVISWSSGYDDYF